MTKLLMLMPITKRLLLKENVGKLLDQQLQPTVQCILTVEECHCQNPLRENSSTSFVWNMDGGIRLLFTFFHSARWLQFVLTRKTDWFPRLKLAKTANIHHIIILYSKHIKNESHIEYIIVRFKALKTDMEAAIFVRYIYRLCLLQNDIIKLSKQGC